LIRTVSVRALCETAVLFAVAAGAQAASAAADHSQAVRLAVERWIAVQKPSGFLPYGFDFLEDRELEADRMTTAHLARQVSTAAVLADYYSGSHDARAAQAVRSLLAAFRAHSLPIGKSRLQRAVEATRILSVPAGRTRIRSALERLGLAFDGQGPGKVLSPTSDHGKAYSGAVALALLTELRYSQASADTSFSDLRRAWLEGLMVLRIPGKGFRVLPTSIDPTPYADGQGWLALAHYHRLFPGNQRVREMLLDLDQTLIDLYTSDTTIDFYHWGAMAAAVRYADTKDARFLEFIERQTSAFLDRRRGPDGDNHCALVEGVADAVTALASGGRGGGETAGRARQWIAREMDKAARLQVRPGQQEFAFAAARVSAPRAREFAGSFLAGRFELRTRVDFTSHCVSAMIKLQRQEETLAKR